LSLICGGEGIRWFSLTEFKARVDTYFARKHQHKQDTRHKMTDRHTSSRNRNYIIEVLCSTLESNMCGHTCQTRHCSTCEVFMLLRL